MSHRFFISYAHEDATAAAEILRFLKSLGATCWMAPDSVHPGQTFSDAISGAIRDCESMLLVFSAAADRSKHVFRELVLADEADKVVIPVRIEDAKPSRLAYHLAGPQRVDFFGDQRALGEARLRELVGDLPAEFDGLGVASAPGDNGWVYIPGSRFLIGAQKTDPKAPGYDPEADDDDEGPVRRVEVRPFWIGRYPVMVEQFRLFVDDGRERAPVDWEQQRQNPRRPAVNVTWHTACAYCEWLSRKTGDRVRLPTEEEWEFAARGPKSRKYPWGEEKPDPTRANYSETKIGAPSPVGQFPKGNTPEGVSDMAGNVWEWTSSDWSTAGKVVRGASFDNGAWRLRAACRIWWSPVYGFGIFGFRCVREVSP